MNFDDIIEQAEERNAVVLGCNVCLNCLEDNKLIGVKYIDFSLGEYTCVAAWICDKCVVNSKIKDEVIISNIIAVMKH